MRGRMSSCHQTRASSEALRRRPADDSFARFSHPWRDFAAMPLDRKAVAHIATLARIRVPEAELDALAGELDQILHWVEQLGEVDTADVAPMSGVGRARLPRRDDKVSDGDCRDA